VSRGRSCALKQANLRERQVGSSAGMKGRVYPGECHVFIQCSITAPQRDASARWWWYAQRGSARVHAAAFTELNAGRRAGIGSRQVVK